VEGGRVIRKEMGEKGGEEVLSRGVVVVVFIVEVWGRGSLGGDCRRRRRLAARERADA
jgi:hypothetical protein